MKYWFAIGRRENWIFSFNHGNVWGFAGRYKYVWDKMAVGDIMLCYATIPVKGVIGYCRIREKNIGKGKFFPDEIKTNTISWPLRIVVEQIKIIPRERWEASKVTIERKSEKLTLQRGIQGIGEENAERIIGEVDRKCEIQGRSKK